MDANTVAIAWDTFRDGRDWPDDGTLEAAIARLVIAVGAELATPDGISAFADVTFGARHALGVDPSELSDRVLCARVLYEQRIATDRHGRRPSSGANELARRAEKR